MANVKELKRRILDEIEWKVKKGTCSLSELADGYRALCLAEVEVMPLFDDPDEGEPEPPGNVAYQEETAIGFCD